MAAQIPKILRNFNIMVDGVGCAGLCDEVELPALSIKTEDHRGAGMDVPIEMDMGMEKMTMKMTFAEHMQAIYRQFGLINGNAVGIIFRAAKMNDTTAEGIEVVARGTYKEIPGAKVKAGDKSQLEATLNLRYYRLTIRGEVLIEIDAEAGTRIIDGVDQLEAVRNLISI